MKCPYCGVHYLDGERECPVCGRRPGIIAPKKKSKFTTQDSSGQPVREKKSSAKKVTHQPESSEAAWQRAAAQNSKNSPKPPNEAQQSGCAPGCLIVAVILIALSVVPGILFNMIHTDFPASAWEDIYDESCELSEVLPSGTWKNEDGSLLVTIYDDGTVSWTDGTDTAEDGDPGFDRLLLTEENASEYSDDEELKNYPISDYTHYYFYFCDSASMLPDYDLHIYVPNDTVPEDITSFGCYDWQSEEFFTLTLTDSSEAPATPVSQST